MGGIESEKVIQYYLLDEDNDVEQYDYHLHPASDEFVVAGTSVLNEMLEVGAALVHCELAKPVAQNHHHRSNRAYCV